MHLALLYGIIYLLESRNILIMRFDLILGFDSKGLLSVNIQPFAVIPSGFNIRNRRFLTFYFLIYIEPPFMYWLSINTFLTVYFLIYIEPRVNERSWLFRFLTFYFLIYIEPFAYSLSRDASFLTFYFLINTNIPSLP